MRITALTAEDFRPAASRSRIRDNELLEALVAMGDVSTFTFASEAHTSVVPVEKDGLRFSVAPRTNLPLANLKTIASGRLIPEEVFNYRSAFGSRLVDSISASDVVYLSMPYAALHGVGAGASRLRQVVVWDRNPRI